MKRICTCLLAAALVVGAFTGCAAKPAAGTDTTTKQETTTETTTVTTTENTKTTFRESYTSTIIRRSTAKAVAGTAMSWPATPLTTTPRTRPALPTSPPLFAS